ncbi:hypothetical protein E2C01_038639 [Portunus trituberculatus]|uniref:Uncharacterized protein n=1 Tax=Portunus trituberculatus TaxID=210409 RepID=A0A5B7FHI0_PORTR|nr:hypothetical protein [Portunus trituberculatus]
MTVSEAAREAAREGGRAVWLRLSEARTSSSLSIPLPSDLLPFTTASLTDSPKERILKRSLYCPSFQLLSKATEIISQVRKRFSC